MTDDENQTPEDEQDEKSQPEPKPTPAEQLKTRLYKDSDFLKAIISDGHSLEDHVGKTPEETLERTLQNIRPSRRSFSSSIFNSEEDYYRYVPQTIAYYADDIVKWLQEPTTDPLPLLYPTEDEDIGYGFEVKTKNPSVFEFVSNNCFLLLTKRDKDDGEDYTIDDIIITTAYPMISNGLGKQQDTDLRPIIQKTPTYQKSNPIKQVWFEHIANNPDLAVFYRKDGPMLEIRVVDEKGKSLIHIGKTPESYTVSSADPTTDTELTQAIRDTEEFPENQLIFVVHGTVHDIMNNMHPAELKRADALFHDIQERVETEPEKERHDPTTPEPNKQPKPNGIQQQKQPGGPSEPPQPRPTKPHKKHLRPLPPKKPTKPTGGGAAGGMGPAPSGTDQEARTPSGTAPDQGTEQAASTAPKAGGEALTNEQLLRRAIAEQTTAMLGRMGTTGTTVLREGQAGNEALEERRTKPTDNKYDE